MQDFGDRFDGIDRRFESLERRLEGFERRVDVRFEAVDARLAGLDQRMSRQFRWLVGGQVSVLVTVVGTLVAALFLR